MNILIKITAVQHIREMQFSIDLDTQGLVCITGKNGAGKTTLVKAIRNLLNADTFATTSADGIFGPTSSIVYEIDGSRITFGYDSALGSLNCNDEIPESLRSSIAVELSIPQGERFTWYPRVSEADEDIRRARVLEQHSHPQELVAFLGDIYASSKFDQLAEVSVKRRKYYFLPLPNDKYLREDYLSSGEYFLISLYRRITSGRKLIVVDEIDISLDAAAQVRLVRSLREFSRKYGTCFVFTTHSLAMMRTLKPEELYYIEQPSSTGVTEIVNVSYNYINSILYGFSGWDKYILTEDANLADFLDFVIQRFCGDLFYSYKIIYVGGGSNTTNLMKRNAESNFLANAADVITVLDGDQRVLRLSRREGVFCIPLESVEKALLANCLAGAYSDKVRIGDIVGDVDALVRYLQRREVKGQQRPLNYSEALSSYRVVLRRLVAALRAHTGRSLYFILHCRQRSKQPLSVATEKQFKTAGRKVFDHLIREKIVSRTQIFEYLTKKYHGEISDFAKELRPFLTLSANTPVNASSPPLE